MANSATNVLLATMTVLLAFILIQVATIAHAFLTEVSWFVGYAVIVLVPLGGAIRIVARETE